MPTSLVFNVLLCKDGREEAGMAHIWDFPAACTPALSGQGGGGGGGRGHSSRTAVQLPVDSVPSLKGVLATSGSERFPSLLRKFKEEMTHSVVMIDDSEQEGD